MTRVVDKDEFNPFETMFQKDPETQNNFFYTPEADSQNFEWGWFHLMKIVKKNFN